MGCLTIDYGIDLGTTNSVIARLNGMEREIIKNNEGLDYTPSVICIDRKERLLVGLKAKGRQESDPANVAYEFKRKMGTDWTFRFERSGLIMKPEELSAEVLKDLKGSAENREKDGIHGVIITVPAAFELPQCDATKKAAELAGFTQYTLLQEPVAAALAYGFQSADEKVFWFVYDLGGGTFDAALINMKDGEFDVVNHIGDNDLGGQLIDWAIIEDILVPAVVREHTLTDFRRGNTKWCQAFAKLKVKTEQAKIELSRAASVDIEIDYLCDDDAGHPIEFIYELKRSDVERLSEPIVNRTISKCRELLESENVGPQNIQKVLLVGGPTLMPYLRERLRDPKDGLGIPLAFDQDPLTVVAEGAAIYAGGQRLSPDLMPSATRGEYSIDLEYKPMDNDPEPLVGGRVISGNGEDVSRFTIEFVNSSLRPSWRSGKVGLAPNGTFTTQLYVEKGIENIFRIELREATGNKLAATPDHLSIRPGIPAAEPPLTHSVGVALVNNEVALVERKATPLPVRKRLYLHTAVEMHAGDTGSPLTIPLIEGESTRADRNQIIGKLEIKAENIRRDVPIGSDVEITVEIDESRLVRMKGYIPLLDEEFEVKIDYRDYRKNSMTVVEMRKALKAERERLQSLDTKVEQTGDSKARKGLQKIYSNRMVQEIESSLDSAEGNEDVAERCHNRLLELRMAIDTVEDNLEWPILVREAEQKVKNFREIVDTSDFGITFDEREEFKMLENEVGTAVEVKDPDHLRQCMRNMDNLVIRILMRQPGWWVGEFNNLAENLHIFIDPQAAEELLQRGREAINTGNVNLLQSTVRGLWNLLPQEEKDRRLTPCGTGVTR